MLRPESTAVSIAPAETAQALPRKTPWYKSLAGTPGKRGLLGLAFVLLVGVGITLGLILGLRNARANPQTTADGRGLTSTTPASPPKEPVSPCVGKQGAYRYAAVASDAEICSPIGSDIMARKGGSAVDAAIATMLCLGLANVHSTGIGGGFFMTLYKKSEGRVLTLDAREVAPGAATKDMYVNDKQASSFGGKSIAVPGEVAGYAAAHKAYGKVPWKELFEPAIKMCTDGVPVSPGLRAAMLARESTIKADKKLRERFIDPKTGALYKLGQKIYYPTFAKTLRAIADEGASAFYNGSLSQKIVDDIKDAGGIITLEDLKNYTAKWRTPVSSQLKDNLRVYSLPPPSSGAIYIYILNLIDGYNFTPKNIKQEPLKTYQRILESFKFAYARRAELGDEGFVDVTTLLSNLTSQSYADATRSRITDDVTHDPSYYGYTTGQSTKQGTSHLSVVAPNGDAVSITGTINLYFGSKVLGNRTDILFNDEMDDFSTPNTSNSFGLPPSPTNFIQPGKRPMSSMLPAIVVDGKGDVKLVIGASGGSKIISATAYATTRVLFFEESLKDAIDAPRLHHQWVPNTIVYDVDPEFPKDILAALKKMGHKEEALVGRGAVIQGILSVDGKLYGYSDTRKGGCPNGY